MYIYVFIFTFEIKKKNMKEREKERNESKMLEGNATSEETIYFHLELSTTKRHFLFFFSLLNVVAPNYTHTTITLDACSCAALCMRTIFGLHKKAHEKRKRNS